MFNKSKARRLLDAAQQGDIEQLERLLDQGVDIETRDKHGWTPLMLAAMEGHTDVVKRLIQKGADIHAKDEDGETAFMQAMDTLGENNTTLAMLLLEHGADIEAKCEGGWTPLMKAAFHGHADMVALLLDKGADIEARAENGWTALMMAAAGGKMETVRLLLDNNADRHARATDAAARTAADFAADFGHAHIAELFKAGATPTAEMQTYIEESKTTTTTKVPLIVSKAIPSHCTACGAPFKGKDGQACDYCGTIIKGNEKWVKPFSVWQAD